MGLTTKLTAGLLTFGTLVTGVLPAIALPGTVTTRSNLRAEPSLAAPVYEILPQGGDFDVINITVGSDGNYWYYVQPRVEGTQTGWIRSDLARLRLDKKPYAMVTGKRGIKTNVRSSPKLNSKVLYTAMSGDVVTLESAPQQVGQYPWYYVRFTNGVRGWVRGDQLSFWQRGCIISCPEY